MTLQAPRLPGFKPTLANVSGEIDLRFWFTADSPINIIEAGPPESFEGLGDMGSLGGDVVNTDISEQPLRVLSSGSLSAQYDNTNDQLVSNIASSNYIFLHDGYGATVFGAGRRTVGGGTNHDFFDTLRALNTRTGIEIFQNGTTEEIAVRIGNSSGTFVVDDSGGAFLQDGLLHTFVFRWTTAAYDLRVDGTSVASGVPTGTPAAGVPNGTLHVGSRSGGASGSVTWRGDWLEGGGYFGTLTDQQVKTLEAYLQRWPG